MMKQDITENAKLKAYRAYVHYSSDSFEVDPVGVGIPPVKEISGIIFAEISVSKKRMEHSLYLFDR